MVIPMHDDRILQYIKPFQGRCPGQGCTAYMFNKRAYEMSDTYWCPVCSVSRRQFVLVDIAQFGPERLEHIKSVVKKHLQERPGYYRNIRY